MPGPIPVSSTSPPALGVVYFGNEWFAENRTSSHHIARRLARQVNLLYVDSPGMRPPSGNKRDLSRLWRKLSEALRPPRRVEPGLWHCTIPQLPWRRLPGVTALNQWLGAWLLRRAMRHAGIADPVLWFVVPHPGFMIDRVPHQLVVYYCIDDYSALPGVDVEHIRACDARLTQRAHRVFVAPPALLESKQRVNAGTRFSPHGVDVELFSRAREASTPVPAIAASLTRPVIGYFGLIAAWTDTDLLAWLAEQRPQWSFLLVGHAHADVSHLARLPNVRLVGAQPYESLPGWAKAFDVAVMPYRKGRFSQNANPLKLREYLATGKPVVTLPLPAVEHFRDVVHLADSREDFLAAIERALLDQDPAAAARRIDAVRDMSWDARVAATLDEVGLALAEQDAGGRLAQQPV